MAKQIICVHATPDSVDLPDGCGSVVTEDFIEIQTCFDDGTTCREYEYL
jgi:hypothetical protein